MIDCDPVGSGAARQPQDALAETLASEPLTDLRAHAGPFDDESRAQLAAAEDHLRQRGLQRTADHPHLAAWRAAFRAFGAKPSKYPSSAAALAGRVLKGESLPRINLLVDLYNAVSVRHMIPVGGEDAEQLEGTLRLAVASGDEQFDPPGDGTDVETVSPGEIVWRDDRGVTCRRWNWRQGRRTKSRRRERIWRRRGPWFATRWIWCSKSGVRVASRSPPPAGRSSSGSTSCVNKRDLERHSPRMAAD